MSIQEEQLINRTIILESVLHEGHYTACNKPGKFLGCLELSRDKLTTTDAQWTRLKVHKAHDDTIVLESIVHPNSYVTVDDPEDTSETDPHPKYVTVSLTPELSSPPLDFTAMISRRSHWRLARVDGGAKNVFSLESNFLRNLFLTPHLPGGAEQVCILVPKPSHHHHHNHHHQDGWKWKLGIGPFNPDPESSDILIRDEYKPVASHKNPLVTPIEFTYKKVVGITVPGGDWTRFSSFIARDMQINFTAGPLELDPKDPTFSVNFSSDWATASSQTWGWVPAGEVEDKVEVPPKKRVMVHQLIGTYPPFTVHSSHFRIEFRNVD